MEVPSLGWEDILEKEMATHSRILAWRIPWTEPGELQSIGPQSVRHDWVTNTFTLSLSPFQGLMPGEQNLPPSLVLGSRPLLPPSRAAHPGWAGDVATPPWCSVHAGCPEGPLAPASASWGQSNRLCKHFLTPKLQVAMVRRDRQRSLSLVAAPWDLCLAGCTPEAAISLPAHPRVRTCMPAHLCSLPTSELDPREPETKNQLCHSRCGVTQGLTSLFPRDLGSTSKHLRGQR